MRASTSSVSVAPYPGAAFRQEFASFCLNQQGIPTNKWLLTDRLHPAELLAASENNVPMFPIVVIGNHDPPVRLGRSHATERAQKIFSNPGPKPGTTRLYG
jgi:hypothetical protein